MSVENDFSLSWDGLVKGTTGAVSVLIVALIIVFSVVSTSRLFAVSVVAFLCCILFLPLLWAPRGYVMQGRIVKVRRSIGDAKLTLAGEPKRWNWTWWSLRLAGSGGLYGYYGYFTFRGLGRVLVYATNRHNMVHFMDQKRGHILISPNDPESFILCAAAQTAV